MLKVSKGELVLFVSVLVFCGVLSCSRPEESVPQRRPVSRWLVSPELLEEARLEIVWDKRLAMEGSESLARIFILGGRVYALSDRNYIVSLDRENGKFVFSRPFAPAGFVVLGLELYEDELVSIVGNRLVEVDAEFGTEVGSERLEFGVTCPAARNSSRFYLAGSDRRLKAFRAEDKVKLFEYAAENDSVITWVVADSNCVVLSTDAGNVIRIMPDKPVRLWQFDAADGIVGPIVRDEGSVFAASKDTYVYKLDVGMGTIPVWKYQTAAVLDRGPVVTRGVVYQYVCGKGLTAIDKNSGEFMWQVEKGADLLAEGDGKAYVITESRELVVMDNRKRKRVCSVNFSQVSKYASNVMDSKIYIADEAGRIVCLRPVD